jgi:hypothetical protein
VFRPGFTLDPAKAETSHHPGGGVRSESGHPSRRDYGAKAFMEAPRGIVEEGCSLGNLGTNSRHKGDMVKGFAG